MMSVPSCLRGDEELGSGWKSVASWMAEATAGAWQRQTSLNTMHLLDSLSIRTRGPALDVVTRVRQAVLRVELGSRRCNSPLGRLVWSSFLTEVSSSGVRAAQIVRTLRDFAYVAGYHGSIEWSTVVLRYWLLDFYCLFIDTLKYHTLWLGNLVKREVTKRKETVEGIDGYLIDSRFRRFCLQKLAKRNWRSNCLSETLQQGLKRGMPSMKDIEIDVQLLDYQLELSREKPLPHEIDWEIRRTAQELCGELLPDLTKNWLISMSAGYSSSRALMGQRGEVIRELQRLGRCSILGGFERELVGLRSCRWQLDFVYKAPDLDYHLVWRTLRERPVDELLRSRVAVIREPLKIRPITAGPSLVYALGKPYQMAMWSSLQENPVFKLTGQTVTPAALEHLCVLPDSSLDMFISGDYSGATNSMSMLATRAAWQTIWGELDERFVKPMLDAHLIELDKTTFVQKNGQLMGSPLSFPILCIVNAAVGRRSYELYSGKTLRVRDCPMLINGDDFAGRSCPEHYRIWQSLVRQIGWSLSPGKSYFSREFVQINSRTFGVTWGIDRRRSPRSGDYLRGTLDCHRPFPIFQNFFPFVNFGYLELLSKDVKQLDEASEEEIATGWEGRLNFMKLDHKTFDRQFIVAKRNLNRQVAGYLRDREYSDVRLRLDWGPGMGGLFFTDCSHCKIDHPCNEHAVRSACDLPSHMLGGSPDRSNQAYLVCDEFPLEPAERSIEPFRLRDLWKEPSRKEQYIGELGYITPLDPLEFRLSEVFSNEFVFSETELDEFEM